MAIRREPYKRRKTRISDVTNRPIPKKYQVMGLCFLKSHLTISFILFMFRVNVVKARPDLSVHCGEGLLYLIILGVLHGTVWWREDAQCGDIQRVRGGGGADTHSGPPPSWPGATTHLLMLCCCCCCCHTISRLALVSTGSGLAVARPGLYTSSLLAAARGLPPPLQLQPVPDQLIPGHQSQPSLQHPVTCPWRLHTGALIIRPVHGNWF